MRYLHWLAAFLLGVQGLLAMANTVVYPRPETSYDTRFAYPLRILQLALAKAGARETLQPSPVQMEQNRALEQLDQPGGGMDVVWTMTSTEREARWLAVRIPIDKGLLGWRLFLIRKDMEEKFRPVRTLVDLKTFTAGQGHDWPDTRILRASGLNVTEAITYDDLFRLIVDGGVDYFPRGINEIWGEYTAENRQMLSIEPHIALHYPTAFYFFVSRKNPKLAEEIRKGLEIAIKDGSFSRYFNAEFSQDLQRADLAHRTIIELANPLLPPQTPLSRRELWYRP